MSKPITYIEVWSGNTVEVCLDLQSDGTFLVQSDTGKATAPDPVTGIITAMKIMGDMR